MPNKARDNELVLAEQVKMFARVYGDLRSGKQPVLRPEDRSHPCFGEPIEDAFTQARIDGFDYFDGKVETSPDSPPIYSDLGAGPVYDIAIRPARKYRHRVILGAIGAAALICGVGAEAQGSSDAHPTPRMVPAVVNQHNTCYHDEIGKEAVAVCFRTDVSSVETRVSTFQLDIPGVNNVLQHVQP